MTLNLLHLCDSLFPLGAFVHSDGLETATATGAVVDVDSLRAWMDVCLDETIGRTDGPVAWRSWSLVRDEQWDALVALDAESMAISPSASRRQASRAMGRRLLDTWRALHPNARLDVMADLAARRTIAPAFPVAFAAACASSGIDRAATVEAFAYTRLAATTSASMRLAPIGQHEAHRLLARTLERVPAIVRAIADRDVGAHGAAPESFAPAMDIAAMSQQYLHSRLFRS